MIQRKKNESLSKQIFHIKKTRPIRLTYFLRFQELNKKQNKTDKKIMILKIPINIYVFMQKMVNISGSFLN